MPVIDNPISFDDFCNGPYRRFSHRLRTIRKDPEGKKHGFIVQQAEVQLLTLLFLEREGHKCSKAIMAATRGLAQSYGYIATGDIILTLADGFVEAARREITKFSMGRKSWNRRMDVNAAFKECDRILRDHSIKERPLAVVGSALKHFLALKILEKDGYVCDGAVTRAEQNLVVSCMETKLAPGPSTATQYAERLINELGLHLGGGEIIGSHGFGLN